MKKLFYLLLLIPSLIFAQGQKSDATLTTEANVIANETAPSGNTKVRIANMYKSIIDSKTSKSESDFLIQGTAPTNLSAVWIDNSSTTVPQAYPIKTYVNGAWTSESIDCNWWDDAGKVISQGRPYVIGYSGQSNVASSFYVGEVATYGSGASSTGDVSFDPYIIVWNDVTSSFKPYDFTDQAGSTGNQWTLNSGANNLQSMGREIAKQTKRSVRFVGSRLGGTPLAAWEAGQSQWTTLVATINSSNVKYLDAFVWIHGEGGLQGGIYTSAFASYRDSFYDFLSRLDAQTWTNGADVFHKKTAVLAPSHALMHTRVLLGAGTEADDAEATIRSLDFDSNPYHGWVRTPFVRGKMEPVVSTVGGSTTSTTSINLSTYANYNPGATVTLTIASGLTAFYQLSVRVGVISRADRSNYLMGTVSTYNNGTGVLVLADISVAQGTVTATDWDVILQDEYHWIGPDHELTGRTAAMKFLSMPNLNKLDNSMYSWEYSRTKGVADKIITTYKPSKNFYSRWTGYGLNTGGYYMGFSAGSGQNDNIQLQFVANGGANSLDFNINTLTGGVLNRYSENIWHTFTPLRFGTYTTTPNANDNTSIGNSVTGNAGIDYRSQLTGAQDGHHSFFIGSAKVLQLDGGSTYGLHIETQDENFLHTSSSTGTRIYTETASPLYGSTVASGTQTAKIVSNDTKAAIVGQNYSVCTVILTVTGVRTDVSQEARGYFSVTRKGYFIRNPTDDFAFVGQDSQIEVFETSDGLVSDLSFTISGGRFGATFTRGATTGTYTHSATATLIYKMY